MRIREVLSQAYSLTIKNPMLWLFGSVMLGGFNLSLINFFSIDPDWQWREWPLRMDVVFGSPVASWIAILFVVAAVFVILNLIKIIFVLVLHHLIHDTDKKTEDNDKLGECLLCTKKDQPLPYMIWLGRVIAASAITIGLTAGVVVATNMLVHAGPHDGPVVIMINLFFIAVVTTLVGSWNIFTSLFVVMYDFNFEQASNAALDLIVNRFRKIVEFIVVLSLIHAGYVLITNGIIIAWQRGLIGGFSGSGARITHLVTLVVVALWFALNNAFFNVAFVVFFDRIVRALPAVKAEGRLLSANRVN